MEVLISKVNVTTVFLFQQSRNVDSKYIFEPEAFSEVNEQPDCRCGNVTDNSSREVLNSLINFLLLIRNDPSHRYKGGRSHRVIGDIISLVSEI